MLTVPARRCRRKQKAAPNGAAFCVAGQGGRGQWRGDPRSTGMGAQSDIGMGAAVGATDENVSKEI
ncbi:hypothetical protein GCM10007927_01730 [Sulfitobacter pacificus]|uniref:Uncharacterized protein n=1 Tax=Sulfitobacter pacificus TaxID=1499314 RepID=A0ABQ5VF22_9RHOB|nr:hypothetical protein GCM10007927_01730 [Sulfitobacter pacificus]